MDNRVSYFILTNGRSGSNYFVNLLNKHPAALNFGEVLGDWTPPWRARRLFSGGDGPESVKRYLDGFFDNPFVFYAGQAAALPDRLRHGRPPNLKRRNAIHAIGVKDFQLNVERRGVVDYLKERAGLRVIGLVRRNPVRRYLSAAMLRNTGQAAAQGREETSFAPLTISPDRFLEGARTVAAENARLSETLASLDPVRRLVVDYADYFGDDDAMRKANRDMFSLLDIEPLDLASEHRKLNSRPLYETLLNYDEIARAMETSELAEAFAEAENGG